MTSYPIVFDPEDNFIHPCIEVDEEDAMRGVIEAAVLEEFFAGLGLCKSNILPDQN